jgi:hypothetical protein
MIVVTAQIIVGLIVAASYVSNGYARVQGPGDRTNRYMPPRVTSCFLSAHRKEVDALLKTLPGSISERAVLKRNGVGIDTCFGINSDGSRWQSNYEYDRMRAGLVRALLLSHRDSLNQLPPAGLANTNWYAANNTVYGPDDATALRANEIGFCIARQNWQGVLAILFAVDPKMERRHDDLPKSADDRESRIVNDELQKIIPSIAKCVPQGTSLVVNRFQLRSLLEETAFHAVGFEIFANGRTALPSQN